MQTRDHKKLAEMFASEMSRKRIPYICKKAFIYGNIEPDKNPFTYLHGMLKGKKFHGHDYENILPVIKKIFNSTQEKKKWGVREYYHFGKLMHYTADVFTFPHNRLFSGNVKDHRKYEKELHSCFGTAIDQWKSQEMKDTPFSCVNIEILHAEYLRQAGNYETDCEYILAAVEMLLRAEQKKIWHMNPVLHRGMTEQFV